jgi:hypothetical protein
MRVAVVGHGSQETNPELVLAWRAAGLEALLLSPEAALAELHPGDIALVRLDVLKTLDGVEPGLRLIGLLEQRGVRVLNPPHALIAAHDKLGTARALRAAGIPHPRTAHVESRRASLELDPPWSSSRGSAVGAAMSSCARTRPTSGAVSARSGSGPGFAGTAR